MRQGMASKLKTDPVIMINGRNSQLLLEKNIFH